jgi:hypothetical protein
VNPTDRFFVLGNHCLVPKEPYSRTSDYAN